jgi:hypothetical protein
METENAQQHTHAGKADGDTYITVKPLADSFDVNSGVTRLSASIKACLLLQVVRFDEFRYQRKPPSSRRM